MWRIGIGGWTIVQSSVGPRCIARNAEVLQSTKLPNAMGAVKSSGRRIWLMDSARNAERRNGAMAKISVDVAKKMILDKLDEVFDIFNHIDHDGELILSFTMMDDYKTCSLYNKDTLEDIFYAYTFPSKGYNNGWDNK
jgi:hypothetical protein